MVNNIKQTLRQMIESWQINPLPEICPREIDLANYFDPNLKKIISVTGFRRTGKTFLLFDFAQKYGKENCVYLNLEDERLPKDISVLTQFIEVLEEMKGEKPLLLLMDEIQEIPDWSRWARRVNEMTRYRLVLSGSSSKLSSAEIPTQLRGRTLTVQVFPLNWREYLQFKKEDLARLPLERKLYLLWDYLNFGGMPEIVLAQAGLRPMLLDDYYQTLVQRDIIGRQKIRNRNALRDLLKLALNAKDFTYSKFANNLKSLGHKIGKSTVVDYLKAARNAYFFSILEIGSASVKKRIQSVKKIYSTDTFFSARYGAIFSQNTGHLMEQAVYLEFLRKRAQSGILEVFFWKDYLGHEADFLLMENSMAAALYQVTYAENMADIAPREIKSLLCAAKKLSCFDLTIITWSLEAETHAEEKKIKYIPLWKFLSEKQNDL